MIDLILLLLAHFQFIILIWCIFIDLKLKFIGILYALMHISELKPFSSAEFYQLDKRFVGMHTHFNLLTSNCFFWTSNWKDAYLHSNLNLGSPCKFQNFECPPIFQQIILGKYEGYSPTIFRPNQTKWTTNYKMSVTSVTHRLWHSNRYFGWMKIL